MKRPALIQDPAFPGVVLFAVIALAGFVAIGFGWRAATGTTLVFAQVPVIISGGLAGLALVFIGAGLVTVQMERRLAALERAQVDGLLDDAAALVDAYRDRDTDGRTA